MKRILALFAVIVMIGGCCIDSRRWASDKEVHSVQTGFHRTYTNGTFKVSGNWSYPVSKSYVSSYVGGPYAYSTIYPATRRTLNALSGWSYSSAASGDYMLNVITLPCYPIILCELPIQFVLDTVLIPFDLWNVPHPPEGWKEKLK